ncbi:MAG: phenylalanine--tRNA ligase subunit beta [Candidatus Thermoplasmatota archaeon]|nr:phenylalanine--tRNA ligase subunit beta [Candidatus Thermoplasmatota archaeon]
MPTIAIDLEDLNTLLVRKPSNLELVKILSSLGGEAKIIDNKLEVEFLSNRPDLFSVEGIARALNSYINVTGLVNYKLKKSNIKLFVDSSVKSIRPFIACALVKNVNMTKSAILSLMDLQEKLHATIGRKRRKVAIGVHDFDRVKHPFTYKAVVPSAIKFVPLSGSRAMALNEILASHEKGIEYKDLLAGFKKYPIILDSHNEVLSFPPIINGALTEVTSSTKSIFIEATGLDFNTVSFAVLLIATALAERGGELYTVEVVAGKKRLELPNLATETKALNLNEANSLLGTKLQLSDVIKCLRRMGFDARAKAKNRILVTIPPYRKDIFQTADLIEDVAIGYGFENVTVKLPKKLTFGEERALEIITNELREIMIGLGFNEVVTLTLSNEEEQFDKMLLPRSVEATTIINPVTKEHTILRVSLLPCLLSILKLNKRHELPHKIFEIGDVIIKGENIRMLACVVIHSKASFAEMKSIVRSLLEARNLEYKLEESARPPFITGRCASIIHNNKEIGYFGELHPKVIVNFELAHPVIALEMLAS